MSDRAPLLSRLLGRRPRARRLRRHARARGGPGATWPPPDPRRAAPLDVTRHRYAFSLGLAVAAPRHGLRPLLPRPAADGAARRARPRRDRPHTGRRRPRRPRPPRPMTRALPLVALAVAAGLAACTPPTGGLTDYAVVEGFRVSPTFNAFSRPCDIRYTLQEPALVQIRVVRVSADGERALVRQITDERRETRRPAHRRLARHRPQRPVRPPGRVRRRALRPPRRHRPDRAVGADHAHVPDLSPAAVPARPSPSARSPHRARRPRPRAPDPSFGRAGSPSPSRRRPTPPSVLAHLRRANPGRTVRLAQRRPARPVTGPHPDSPLTWTP